MFAPRCYNASILNYKMDSKRLEAYLRSVIKNDDSRLTLNNGRIKISNVMRMGGGATNDIYSFLLSYTEKHEEKQIPLVIKTFSENVDPIFKSYIHDRDLRKSVREWEALTSLERVGFAVPKAYFCECDSRYLGYPFLIMDKLERSQRNIEDNLKHFAECLSDLHNLEIDRLRLRTLKPPKDGYAFARRWPIHFKHALNIETKHSTRLRKDFDSSIRWLESNASSNYCSKYSLIHGDAHPANAFHTNDSKTTLVDWETVDIGDPAFDVAYAYHMIKFFCNPKNPDSAEQTAERFLSQYLERSKADVRPRLKFYELVAIMGYAIPYSSGLSSPIRAYKYHRRKVLQSIPVLRLPLILLASPFLRWPFVARKMGADGELEELRYFESFVGKLRSDIAFARSSNPEKGEVELFFLKRKPILVQ